MLMASADEDANNDANEDDNGDPNGDLDNNDENAKTPMQPAKAGTEVSMKARMMGISLSSPAFIAKGPLMQTQPTDHGPMKAKGVGTVRGTPSHPVWTMSDLHHISLATGQSLTCFPCSLIQLVYIMPAAPTTPKYVPP